ncbi:hypothetical protein [Thomasclavelia sp.]|nr:hypothetical protein [Thomasclavelia sp.]
MSEEWKKELLVKYFVATFNLSESEALKFIEDNFNEITLDEKEVKRIIMF